MSFQFNVFTGTFDIVGTGGGGSMAIGGAVTGGTSQSVLFIGPTGLLAQDNPGFTFNGAGNYLTTGSYEADVGGGGGEYFIARNTAAALVGNASNIIFKNLRQDAVEATFGKIALEITEDGLDSDGSDLVFYTYTNPSLNEGLRISASSRVGVGVAAPDAWLHLRAGIDVAGYAPLKFTSGPLLSTAEAGTVQFLSDKFYAGITTGPATKEFTLNDSALTDGLVPVATTNGRLTTYGSFAFNGSTDRLFIMSDYGAATLSTVNLSNTSAGDVVNQTIQAFSFNDELMGLQDFAHIIGQSLGITSGGVYGGLNFRLRLNGTFTDILSLNGLTGITTSTLPLTIDCTSTAKFQAGTYKVWSRTITGFSATAGAFSEEFVYTQTSPGGYNGSFIVNMSLGGSGISQSKTYIVNYSYNGTNNVWKLLNPIASTGIYPAAEDIALDININNAVMTLRIRRVSGSFTASVNLTVQYSNTLSTISVVDSATTGTGATVTGIYSGTPLTQVSDKVGIGTAAPISPLTLGDSGINNSVDAMVLVTRAVDTTVAGNGHCFSDSSTITRTGTIGYNSYDGRVTLNVTMDHYAAFQAIPIISSGTITNYYGLYSGATHNGGTVTNWYGVYAGAATSGSGAITTFNGVYIATPSEVPTTDYGLRIAARSAATSAHDIWLESDSARVSMGASRDLILTRDSAYTLQLWIDTASPLTSTIQGNGAVGTNITGAAFQVGGGQGTGTGAGGPINFRVSPAGGSGASQNAYVTAATITSTSRLGINTTAPDTVLEVNLGTAGAIRHTYNDANGSATTYMDTTLSSTGLTTFTAAGSAKGFVFSDPIRLKGYTVAGLPTGVTGDVAYVTDQLTAVAAKGVAPTGGGAVVCVVMYNGAAWVGI